VVDIGQKPRYFRLEEEVEVSSHAASNYLDRRIAQIESIVDDHVRALHGDVGLDFMSSGEN